MIYEEEEEEEEEGGIRVNWLLRCFEIRVMVGL